MKNLDVSKNNFCEKCSGKLGVSKTCAICGHDNSEFVPKNEMKDIRSKRLTIFCAISQALSGIMIIISLITLLAGQPPIDKRITLIISIIFLVFEIVLCNFILKFKLQARNIYLGIVVVGMIPLLLRLNILAILFRALLLYFVLVKDWDEFK